MRSPRIAWMTLALAFLCAPLARADGVEDGKHLAKERRWPQAAEAFRAALKSSPTSRDGALGLANAVAEGRLADLYEEATKTASAALKSKPDDREMRLAYGYLFLARATEDERWRADAQEQFQRVLKANPDDEDATIALARYYYFGGDYVRGQETLDEFLGKKPGSASAHFWKGMLLYDEAEQAVRGGVTPASTALFQKAAAAFEASTKADGTRAEAWIRLAYACQYLVAAEPARAAQAEAAYLKALDLDPADDAPLRGVRSLHSGTPAADAAYAAILARLAKEKPKSPAVLYRWADELKSEGKIDDAIDALKAHIAAARAPARGWFDLAEILREKKGDEAGARKAYEAALKSNPRFPGSENAVYWLVAPLEVRGRDAVRDVGAARAVLKEYEAVIALSPQSLMAHNNAAFFLREAYRATGDRHRDLLDACVAHYVAASDVVREFQPAYVSMPYADRHGYAQVLNDTGLMFQYYKPIEDLGKAESYYRRAMDWTEYGYWDSYGNMMKILEAQNRLQDALDFAEKCAEGIKKSDGTPQPDFRRICQGDVERVKKLLAK